ncbi:SAP domain-containing protein [Amycolatopsis benzoatilytica]|uniref:SAP domain-containing protein n=1 Tax=Amycolatopsis benzoatilytica TaxID=346045 RepID=UPI0003740DCE|nr:SAP domain-containing protein [Amycolatopsis benzoatilytica]
MPEDHRALYEAGTVADLAAELNSRGLSAKGDKPDLVDRLLEHDAAQAPADPGGDQPPADDSDGEICGACWPEGWPGDDSAATCAHGSWTRA